MKKALFLHGWGGTPDQCWFPWLEKKMIEKGYEVLIPELPNTELPVLSEQLEYINSLGLEFKEGDVIIGHSLGCGLATQYIENNSISEISVILVAPVYNGLSSELGKDKLGNAYETLAEYYETPYRFDNLQNKYILFLSDNDPYINQDNALKHYNNFSKNEGNTVTPIYFKNMHHFSDSAPEPIKELPEILTYI